MPWLVPIIVELFYFEPILILINSAHYCFSWKKGHLWLFRLRMLLGYLNQQFPQLCHIQSAPRLCGILKGIHANFLSNSSLIETNQIVFINKIFNQKPSPIIYNRYMFLLFLFNFALIDPIFLNLEYVCNMFHPQAHHTSLQKDLIY